MLGHLTTGWPSGLMANFTQIGKWSEMTSEVFTLTFVTRSLILTLARTWSIGGPFLALPTLVMVVESSLEILTNSGVSMRDRVSDCMQVVFRSPATTIGNVRS